MHVETWGWSTSTRTECNNCHSTDGHVAVRKGLRCVVARFEPSPYLVNDSGGGTFARKINEVSSPVHPHGDAAYHLFRIAKDFEIFCCSNNRQNL